MAKKLISYNGDAEEGDRLPEVVKDEILAYTEFAALPDGIADLDTAVTGAELDTLAADAVRTTDTSTVDMSFVIDEDSFASDSDTKVPTQQSVKAYVDANGGGGGGGGTFTLSPTGTKTSSYTAAAGQWIPVDSSGGGAITITLPVTPPDGSLVGIYVLDADGAITLAAGAGSELNHDGSGTTSLPLYTASSGYTPLSLWRYEVTGNFWHLTSYTTMPLAADIQDSTALGRMVLTGSYADLYEAADILIGGHHSETFGDGVETSFAITHNLGFEDVLVVVREVSSGDYVQTDITITDSDTVTLTFQNAPAEDSLRVTVSAPGGPLFIDGAEAAEGGTAVQFTAQGVAAGDPVALPSATWSSIVGRPASSADTTAADGVTDDRAALAADDDNALAASLPLMLQPGIYKVSSNLTIDSPVWFAPGAILKPDDGITVTLAGGIASAPPSQIFDCSAGGSFVVQKLSGMVSALWFGAVGDDSTDDTDALQAWLDCVVANNAVGWLPIGTYKTTSMLTAASAPAGYSVRGEHPHYVILKQHTSNTAVLQIGDTDNSTRQIHWENIRFTYNVAQSSSNTNANCIVFAGPGSSQTTVAYGTFRRLSFINGYYAMKLTSGEVAPWACEFDMLYMGGMSGGFYDNTGGVGGVPNNRWGRMTLYCDDAVGPIFKNWNQYNSTADAIEFLRADAGPKLITAAAGFSCDIGSMKLEFGEYTSATNLVEFGAQFHVRIGQFIVDSSPGSTFTPSSGVLAVFNCTSGSAAADSYLDIGHLRLEADTVTGTCVGFSSAANSARFRVGNVKLSDGWELHNRSASSIGDRLIVSEWVNGRLSGDKGDADYTVTVGDPNVVHFGTAFTAQRTITLPSKTSNNTCSGLYYDLVFDGAINGANTALIKEGTTTLRTQTVDKKKLRFMWRRSTWVLVEIVDLSAPSSAYTPTNVSTDRAFDADTVAVAELADVVGTLIADLKAKGILG